jgi:hypothetical protein
MLTLIESISLAGDRKKQNDDAFGFAGSCAWIIDGATDLHDRPLTGFASDASWIAHCANSALHAHVSPHPADDDADLRELIATIVFDVVTPEFNELTSGASFEKWQSPIASLLLVTERSSGVSGIDLGDCRAFALDADGAAQTAGGPQSATDAETQLAAQQTDAHKPLLERTSTIAMLRRMRAELNESGAPWTFGLDPECAKQARSWKLDLRAPAHVLLMTDGFSALVDRYGAYDAAGLMRAALDRGLQELGRELRAIETTDASAAKHARFKASDDATALLLRLS